MDLLAPYRAAGEGGCPVLVHYENAGASCDVALGEAWRVRPDEHLLGRAVGLAVARRGAVPVWKYARRSRRA